MSEYSTEQLRNFLLDNKNPDIFFSYVKDIAEKSKNVENTFNVSISIMKTQKMPNSFILKFIKNFVRYSAINHKKRVDISKNNKASIDAMIDITASIALAKQKNLQSFAKYFVIDIYKEIFNKDYGECFNNALKENLEYHSEVILREE